MASLRRGLLVSEVRSVLERTDLRRSSIRTTISLYAFTLDRYIRARRDRSMLVAMAQDSADVELVISGIGASDAGMTERQRLDTPTRFKMLVTHATADGAGFEINRTPVVKEEFTIALEMAKVRQLDRIADLLERVVAQMDERRKG